MVELTKEEKLIAFHALTMLAQYENSQQEKWANNDAGREMLRVKLQNINSILKKTGVV